MDEMTKLRNALDKAGVSWINKTDYSLGIIRTHFTNKYGENCSVIGGEFAYGGKAGLLEVMPPIHREDCGDKWQNEVEGWLTADEIIEAWIKGA